MLFCGFQEGLEASNRDISSLIQINHTLLTDEFEEVYLFTFFVLILSSWNPFVNFVGIFRFK